MMVTFIDAHRNANGVESICAQLPIAPSTYYAQQAQAHDPTQRSARAQHDATLRVEIQRASGRRTFASTGRARSGGSSDARGS
jgi:hypothetical protein